MTSTLLLIMIVFGSPATLPNNTTTLITSEQIAQIRIAIAESRRRLKDERAARTADKRRFELEISHLHKLHRIELERCKPASVWVWVGGVAIVIVSVGAGIGIGYVIATRR
jgi:hypothetical protein